MNSSFVYLLMIAMMFLVACGDSAQNSRTKAASDQIAEIKITNRSADTLHHYGLDVDLIPIDTHLILTYAGEEVPFQFEDRNVNGLPDRLFASVWVPPLSVLTFIARNQSSQRSLPDPRVQAVLQNGSGKRIASYVFGQEGGLKHDGVILENERIAYRALMKDAFAFDVIGKRFSELMTHQTDNLSEEAKWGGDVLGEGRTLGIGSPALYDQTEIVRFDQFDGREVKVLAAGPLRAEIETTIRGIPVRGEKLDVSIVMEMQAGAQYVEVTLELLSSTDLTLQFAFGLPKHEEATDFTQGLEGGVHFAYTHGLQSAQGEQLGLALLVPQKYELDHYRDNPHDYFYLAAPIDNQVTYRFLAAWVKGPRTIFDEVDFLNLVRAEARTFGNQPEVKVTWASQK